MLSDYQKSIVHPAQHRHPYAPLAVFDCDGTVIKGDIGEAMLYRQIELFFFKVSPASVWPDHPAGSELDRLYHNLRDAPGARSDESPEFRRFADLILSWYFDQNAAGMVEKGCMNIVQLFAGFSCDEVRRFARETYDYELRSPVSTRTLGGRTLPRGIRFIEESVALIRDLQRHQFDIWAISGSNQWSVEPVFSAMGISLDRVIGISLSLENGILQPTATEPVPIKSKKVDALRQHLDHRPLIVASDSPFDIPLLQYSAGIKVLVASGSKPVDRFFDENSLTRDEGWLVIDQLTLIQDPA